MKRTQLEDLQKLAPGNPGYGIRDWEVNEKRGDYVETKGKDKIATSRG